MSTSWFVPKPHTAFQWEGQITAEEYQRRVDLLRWSRSIRLMEKVSARREGKESPMFRGAQ